MDHGSPWPPRSSRCSKAQTPRPQPSWRPRAILEFSVLARQHNWRSRSIPFPGTIGIIDPSALFHDLRPILNERAEADLTISASGDTTTFAAEGKEYSVEAAGPLAALVFGGDTPEAGALPPAPPGVEARLRRLFPLPLLWQGYNYV